MALIVDELSLLQRAAKPLSEQPPQNEYNGERSTVKAGDQVSIKITDSDEYDLFGELTTESEQI